jgi:hypothetical protein
VSETKAKRDRLEELRERLTKVKVYYSVPNPRSDYQMDIEDAGDDFGWMIYEIERLRGELAKRRRGGPGGA